MEIYIYPQGQSKKKGIRIPWIPEEIEWNTGEKTELSYNILDYGEITVPVKKARGGMTFSWSGIFPSAKHKGLPFMHGTWHNPRYYSKRLTDWKNNGTSLVLLATGTRINHKVYISSYTETYSGGFGDVEYTIEFKWRRDVQVKVVKKKKKSSGNPDTDKKVKGKTSTPQNATTYTIKTGDTLWKIAEKQLGSGSKYTKIYEKNKTILDQKAKDAGFKDSKGGSLIFAGTKITIPR